MSKIVEIGIAIAVVIMMLTYFIIPIIGQAMTEETSENFASGTGAAETTETVTLTDAHYYDDYDDMSVSSDNTSDTPAILGYTPGNEQVVVGGLVVSGSRILSVEYVAENAYMDTFMGLQQVFLIIPVLIILVILYKLAQSFNFV